MLSPLGGFVEIAHDDGSGSSWSGDALPDGIIKWARDRLLVAGVPLTPERWHGTLDRCVDDLRALVAGERVEVPVAISLAGLPLPRRYSADLAALGTLRAPTDLDLAHSELVEDPTAILMRSRPATMTLTQRGGRLPIRYMDADRDDRQAGERVLLAATLAIGSPSPGWLQPDVLAVERCYPLHGLQRTGSRRDHRRERSGPGPDERHWLESLPEWAERLVRLAHPALAFAEGRLLRALRDIDPADALVDAFVACQSLAGTSGGQGEPALIEALCAVAGHDTDRESPQWLTAVRARHVRDRLIQGQREEPDLVRQAAGAALSLAADALRRLYTDLESLRGDLSRGERILSPS